MSIDSDNTRVRILVVDDEAAHMMALCHTLRDNGYETLGVGSGEAALAELEKRRFDLMLSDMAMPGMDGIALLKAASKIDPQLVSIIMTGEGTIDSAVEAIKSGAFDYILKPFKLSFILPVIVRALGVRRLQQENSRLATSLAERAATLEIANRELESFSYSVSHDLRAPLRAILGYSRMLEEDYESRLDDGGKQLIGKIQSNGLRMDMLINELLALSRLGRQAMTTIDVDMQKLVQGILADIQASDTPCRGEIVVEPLPAGRGDPLLLRQVWFNLLSNAVKFSSKKDHPHIVVSGRRDESGNIYCVRDNGAGFDMNYQEKLFGIFQRLHSNAEFEGTGVGLAIVQRMIARHGGRVWAEGEVEKGATFCFSLPMQAEESNGRS